MSHSNVQGLAHHFDDLEQQHESAAIGMWAFLITEIMFFGGVITAYILMRWKYPQVFLEASHELDWVLGGVNTLVLLVSSLTMALAVHAAQDGKRKATVNYLIVTMILGAVFLVVKAFEYHHKYEVGLIPGADFTYTGTVDPNNAQIFFFLYFAMTGIHALHMVIGIGVVAVVTHAAWKGKYTKDYNNPVEMTGLYWHFVDIVWIFLYPLLYLIDLTSKGGGGH